MKNKKEKEKKDKKSNKKQRALPWFLGVSALAVVLLLSCQFFFENTLTGSETFVTNTKINGIEVGGLSVAEAENVVFADMLKNRDEIEIKLKNGEKEWKINGDEFEIANKIQPAMANFIRYGKDGNFFQNLITTRQIKENGKNFEISYLNILANVDEKLEGVIREVEQESRVASLVFNPNSDQTFEIDAGQNAILVNRDELRQKIDDALKISKKVEIEIPIVEIENEIDVETLKNSVAKRSEFSTSYASSSKARKNNVKKAILSFNGMIVQPGQSVSFNETTGPRTESEGYDNAHIIVGGVYVDGVGGGVCQASTTLYNALILADVEILSVNHHSLPASYVPLSFDAMVSGSYSDLVFKNNLDCPIYIKTSADENVVKVEIFGQPFEDGVSISTRSSLVKVLPHGGDKIVPDAKGEYSNKILYKGEYYRVKYPREGYESKGYVQYFKNGELVDEKEIRHDFYQAQNGIIYEGVEDVAEGMTVPPSDVKIIKPQKVTKSTGEAVKNKLEKTNPSQFNP